MSFSLKWTAQATQKMHSSQHCKRSLLISFAVFLVLIALPISGAYADTYTDTEGHWASEAIERWSDLGILKGSGDGLFRPDDLVTHGELAVILNRVMRYPPAKWQYFNDTNGIWYEADANALMEQRVYGFIGRDSLGGRSISRESALSMIFDSFSVYLPDEQITKSFIDSDQIQASCKHAAKNMLNMGFISGFEDGSLRPKERLTRAQVVTILNNIIEVYITEPGIYDAPLGKRVCIVVPGVTLRGQDLDYLVVTPGAREGLTVIEDCIVRNGTFWNKFGGEEVSIIRYHLPDANITERIIVMADERFGGGSGLKEDPYLIGTQAQLECLHQYTGTGYKKTYFQLINDISLTGDWTPVGMKVPMDLYGFMGHFDGGGYTISNISINLDTSEYLNVGFFGAVCESGSISNLTVKGKIDVRYSGKSLSDSRYVISMDCGGLVGGVNSHATIENCHAQFVIRASANITVSAGVLAGRVSHSSLIRCSSSGSVIGKSTTTSSYDDAFIGGLLGMIDSSMVNGCYSTADVTAYGGHHSTAGGMIGQIPGAINPTTVRDCFASGAVYAANGDFQNNAGGFSGQIFNALVENCFAIGSVTIGLDNVYHVAGGFASGVYEEGITANCYATGDVIDNNGDAIPMSGSFTGRLEGEVKNCYATGNTTITIRGQAFTYNTIVGSRRGKGGIIVACVELTDNDLGVPFFIDETDNSSFFTNKLTKDQLSRSSVYTDHGWDFASVWRMLPDGSSYRLPIVRGSFEKEQQALQMPEHLK